MADETGRGSPNQNNGDGTSPTPAALEDVPLREEQIRNAVGFLSHPKVRGSSESSKRSFLEQKGLTALEIAEAFRRVPEATVPSTSVSHDVPPLPSAALTTTVNHLQPAPYAGPQGTMQQMKQHQGPEPIRWSQVALGAGFCAAGAYAVKSLVWPFVHDKYSAWRSRDGGEPASPTASPTDATTAVADAIRAQTAELATSIQAIQELVTKMDSKRSPSPDDRLTASELREELRSFASTLNEIAAPAAHSPGGPSSSVEIELAEIKALLSDFLKTPRSGERTPTDVQDSRTTPASYRSASERPILSSNASPEQLPRPEPKKEQDGEKGQAPEPASGAHPASYMEVLEMLERGETPPGIRTDINDKPPDPEQEPAPSRMQRPLKPWEQPASTHIGNGVSAADGDGSSISLTPQIYQAEGEGEDLESAARAPSGGANSINSNTETESIGASPHKELSANGRRKAASIYEAATTSSNASPSVIAGRLSPVPGKPRGRAQGALFPDLALDTTISGTPGSEAYQGNAPPSVGSVQSSMGMPDGSGLGRPGSRGWQPPPLPMPTISGYSLNSISMPQSASGKSLGDDFSSA